MVVLKYAIGYLLAVVFMIVIYVGLIVFSALSLQALIIDFELAGLIGWAFFFLVGILGLYAAFGSVIRVEIGLGNQRVIVGGRGLFVEAVDIKQLVGYRFFTHRTKFKNYRAFFIETVNGNQFAFNAFQLDDFNAAYAAVVSVVPNSYAIKRRFWVFGSRKLIWLTCVVVVVIYALVFGYKQLSF